MPDMADRAALENSINEVTDILQSLQVASNKLYIALQRAGGKDEVLGRALANTAKLQESIHEQFVYVQAAREL